ncbi:radical SAM protein [uncultured Brachyspira sp.]|uniref:radical SAM protein n=1 Tax=uncultured Brachyspira sp. TaxID=221953 RepID=UPI002613C7DC|nr:radical SAM protein [uncultured Brachyspira sp.]
MPDCNTICNVPFGFIEIFPDGNVYTCCPAYIKNGCIGNIFKEPFENIINSEKAIEIRTNALNKNYFMCNLDLCSPNTTPFSYQLKTRECFVDYKEKINKVNIIKFSYDTDCNIRCKICRDNFIRNSKERIEELDLIAEKYFLPILKYTDKVCFSGTGDPLASRHTRNFIKLISKEYPNIKFDLHTNGLLLNKNMLEELNIIDRISIVQISIHASNKNIYNKIVEDGNFDVVMENIYYLQNLKLNGKLEEIHLNFVVTKDNIDNAEEFLILSEKLGVECFFWTMRDFGTSYSNDNNIVDDYKIYTIFSKDIFKYKKCHFNPYIYNIVYGRKFIDKYLLDKIDLLLCENKILYDKIEYLVNQNELNIKNINKIVNTLSWWIPIKKLRDNFRNKFKIEDQTRPDQTRPDQTRPDQTRPDQTMN